MRIDPGVRAGNGEIEVAFWGGRFPNANIAAATRHGARLLQVVGPEIEQFRAEYPFLRATVIPAGTYPGIDHVVHETRANTGLTLLMAFNYGGRDELLDAFRTLARQVRAGALAPEDIDEAHISGALYTDGVPDPDLLIRTSGEMRISNFLLWQIAYTELWITPILWPDFRAADLYRAIADFQQRNRRFGGV